MMLRRTLTNLVFFTVVLGAPVCLAQSLCEPVLDLQLLPASRVGTYEFGHAIAVSNGIAVIGMPEEWNRFGAEAGAASIFEVDSTGHWREVAKVYAPLARPYGHFGSAVAATDQYVFVTELDSGPFGSHVYAFRRTDDGRWPVVAELEPEDRDGPDQFGWAMAADGDTLLVGAIESSPRAGFVTVMRLVGGTWQEVARLRPPPDDGICSFGRSLAIDEGTAVIGANDRSYPERGFVYVFEEQPDEAWVQVAMFEGVGVGYFGESVSIFEDRIAVGLPWEASGYVYVYERGDREWKETVRISGPGSNDGFGTVALTGDHLFVGAPRWDWRVRDAGFVYHYQRERTGAWRHVEELEPLARRFDARFGQTLAASEGRLFVGAPGDANRVGTTYVFDIDCTITLEARGACPGVHRLDSANGTPRGRVAFVYGFGTGSSDLPFGTACAGASLDLDSRLRVGRVVEADAIGRATARLNIPPAYCGSLIVQALDLETCAVSQLVVLR